MDAAALKSILAELEFTSSLPGDVHDRIVGCSQDQTFGAGQVVMVLLTTLTTTMVVSGGRSAWFLGVQLLAVYAAFAVTLYLLPS